MKNARLVWEHAQRVTRPVLAERGLVVTACPRAPKPPAEPQVILRALDGGGRVLWEHTRPNVDLVRIAPHRIGGLIVAALVMVDRTARVLDLDGDGKIVVERELPGRWPLLADSLSFDYTVLVSSPTDDRFAFSAFRAQPHSVFCRAGEPGFLWESAAGVSGLARGCVWATLPVDRRKKDNPGFAALDSSDGAIVWEADRVYNGLGTVAAGDLFLEAAGSIWNRESRTAIGLLALPEGRIAWRTHVDGKGANVHVGADAAYVTTRTADGWLLTTIDWTGVARARPFTSPVGDAHIEMIAAGHGYAAWRANTTELWCTPIEEPGDVVWRAPSGSDRIDDATFTPDGLVVVSDRKTSFFG